MVPAAAPDDDADSKKPTPTGAAPLEKPNFSLPQMSSNFRRFNARIGVVFVFQNRLIRLFSWETPSHTLSFLAVYTFCCLDPSLLVALPLVGCLFFIMVPAFLARHPSPPNSELTDVFVLHGPASAPPKMIRPAPDMSKDFFRNMRDLQNSMEDFTVVHDQLVALIGPLTNFSNESLSSTVFTILFLSACLLIITAFAIPWRVISLVGGWFMIVSSHPAAAAALASLTASAASSSSPAQMLAALRKAAAEDTLLDEPAETRQVEIFELQKHQSDSQWQHWVYSPSPYDPQSPRRISGERPSGTRFFEDVAPPHGWEWKDKKWALDPSSRDWVEERLMTAVEIEMEGDRWVYDISASEEDASGKGAAKPGLSWEEGTGSSPKGDWRRRRWVRDVQRKAYRAG